MPVFYVFFTFFFFRRILHLVYSTSFGSTRKARSRPQHRASRNVTGNIFVDFEIFRNRNRFDCLAKPRVKMLESGTTFELLTFPALSINNSITVRQ